MFRKGKLSLNWIKKKSKYQPSSYIMQRYIHHILSDNERKKQPRAQSIKLEKKNSVVELPSLYGMEYWLYAFHTVSMSKEAEAPVFHIEFIIFFLRFLLIEWEPTNFSVPHKITHWHVEYHVAMLRWTKPFFFGSLWRFKCAIHIWANLETLRGLKTKLVQNEPWDTNAWKICCCILCVPDRCEA